MLVLLVLSAPAPAKRSRKKCAKLCRDAIHECAATTCDPLPKKKLRRRCRKQCRHQTLAACRQDPDRTRCVPPTTTTTVETTTTTTTLQVFPVSGPIFPIAIAQNDAYLVNVNPDVDTITVFGQLSAPAKLAEIPVGRDPTSVAIHPDTL